MRLGRFRFGFHRHGRCWSFLRFYRNNYFSDTMTVRGWWRFFIVTDRRMLA